LFVDGEYVAACTITGKKYYLDHSLDKIEQALPASIFFRLNRQYLLNRRIITGFKRAENGKLNVLISKTNFFPGEITVSRIKASTFKGWFHPADNISS
jgi:DNA-binding LytR/AlgR family response regulator